MHSWKKLFELCRGKSFIIKKVYVPEDNISIEGDFQLSNFATLNEQDQKFIAAFIKTHGSIKQMEQIFNISYPTVKNKLNELSKKLDNYEYDFNIEESVDVDSVSNILDKIASGEMDVKQALKELKS
ncbi:MAG: DUF2089 domain-containing protein [Pleomorphochaeta sp.]